MFDANNAISEQHAERKKKHEITERPNERVKEERKMRTIRATEKDKTEIIHWNI